MVESKASQKKMKEGGAYLLTNFEEKYTVDGANSKTYL